MIFLPEVTLQGGRDPGPPGPALPRTASPELPVGPGSRKLKGVCLRCKKRLFQRRHEEAIWKWKRTFLCKTP